MILWDTVWLWIGLIGTSIITGASLVVLIYARKGLDSISILYLLVQVAVLSLKTSFWFSSNEDKGFFLIPDLVLTYLQSTLFWLFFYDFRLIFVTVRCESMNEYQH